MYIGKLTPDGYKYVSSISGSDKETSCTAQLEAVTYVVYVKVERTDKPYD